MDIKTKFDIGDFCFLVLPNHKEINILEDKITKIDIIINENYSIYNRFDIWCETKKYFHLEESYFHKTIEEAIEFQKNYWRVTMSKEEDMTVAYNCKRCNIAVIREITKDKKTFKYCQECEKERNNENIGINKRDSSSFV